MENELEDNRGESYSSPYWRAQPRWFKIAAAAVVMPAWIILVVLVMKGSVVSKLSIFCFSLIMMVAIIQIFFVASAYWKREI